MSSDTRLSDDERERLTAILDTNAVTGPTRGHFDTRVPPWWCERYAAGACITSNPRSDTSIHIRDADAARPLCGDESDLDRGSWKVYDDETARPDRPWCKKCRRHAYQNSGVAATMSRHAAAEGAQVNDHPFCSPDTDT